LSVGFVTSPTDLLQETRPKPILEIVPDSGASERKDSGGTGNSETGIPLTSFHKEDSWKLWQLLGGIGEKSR